MKVNIIPARVGPREMTCEQLARHQFVGVRLNGGRRLFLGEFTVVGTPYYVLHDGTSQVDGIHLSKEAAIARRKDQEWHVFYTVFDLQRFVYNGIDMECVPSR